MAKKNKFANYEQEEANNEFDYHYDSKNKRNDRLKNKKRNRDYDRKYGDYDDE